MRTAASLAALLFVALPLTAQTSTATHSTSTTTHTKKMTAAHRRAISAHRPPHVARTPALIVRTSPAPAAAVPTSIPVLKPAPFAQNPINQLRGNANVLLIFAPDSSSIALHRQLQLLDHHELTLTERDTVLIPEVAARDSDYIFPGENLSAGSPADQLSARQKFGLRDDQFAIILLNKNGVEQFRSPIPVSPDVLASELDAESGSDGNRSGR